jgi:hypothetical protein
MDERVATAAKQTYRSGCPGWEEYELGSAAMLDADHLAFPAEGKTSALLLLRAAAALLVRAELSRVGIDPGPEATAEDCWARLAGHPSLASVMADATEEERSFMDAGLSSQGQRRLVELPQEQRGRAVLALLKLTRGLAAPMEEDSLRLRTVLVVRWARITACALAVGVGIWPLVAEIRSLTAAPNLALHRRVTVDNPHPTFPIDPSALVDGNRSNLGFHTAVGQNQHVTIDLGSIRRISRVVVYNRVDCCQGRAVPLRVELSADGQNFRRAAERADSFDRWQVKLPPTDVRHVRLTDLSTNAFHLSEVEVY